MDPLILSIVKVFVPATISFFIGMALTPWVAHYLYKNKMWKKKSVRAAMDGSAATISQKLHNDENKKTPRMGGVVVWGSVFITIVLFWIISKLFPGELTEKLNFLSRNQTWLPLFTLVIGSIIGLVDDYFDTTGKLDHIAGGLSLKKRLLMVFFIALIGAWWFFVRLEVSSVMVPFWGEFELGLMFIPFFIGVMMAVYASGVIDGIDGLSGGVFAIIFAAYASIAFFQNQIDLAAFCTVIVGGLLAFLWFNIPPARFYMSETGTMGLTLTLSVVAFLTNTALFLPIIAFPLFVTVVGNVVQVASKKVRGKKVFLVAPIHHHFEAIGWPPYKVVMRYWVIGLVSAIIGMILVFIS